MAKVHERVSECHGPRATAINHKLGGSRGSRLNPIQIRLLVKSSKSFPSIRPVLTFRSLQSLPPLSPTFLSSTMSDSIPASPRPSAFPTPSRNPPGPPSSRSVAILASRGHGATPIPPSLQAKMAAVCTLSISVCSSVDVILQMAKRVPQTPDIDCTTAAFKRVSLGAPTTQLRTPSGGPLRSSSGMAARRNKPSFKLSDITGEQETGGGTASAGPAAVVPNDAEWPPRRPAAVTNTPFANFGKIVYVLLVLLRLYPLTHLIVIHLAHSILTAKPLYIPPGSTFLMGLLSPSTWINSSSVKSSVTAPTVPSSESSTGPPT